MTIHCPTCGKEVKPGGKFCGQCGTIIPPEKTESLRETRVDDASRIFVRVAMPQGIELGVDEQVVKQYRIGRYTLRQGYVDVIVTNKRVIRYEDSNWLGMQSNRIDEVNIDAVHGVSCTMARSASILGLAAAGIMGLVGLVMFFGAFDSYYMNFMQLIPGVALIGIAALILVNSFRPSMVFCIQGALGTPSLETSVNVLGRLFGRNSSSIIFQFKPTAETTVMLKEIGACIYDLKTLGDKAITKWRK